MGLVKTINTIALGAFDASVGGSGGGGGGGGSIPTLTTYTGNTGTTITITNTTSSPLVKVYKNGVLLEPTEDYTINGTTLTLIVPLEATDKITTEVF